MELETQENKNEIVVTKEGVEIANEAPLTPMMMLDSARRGGASLEEMQQLMDMQFKWEANEARKAYFQAISDFKLKPLIIKKDKINTQYDSPYTSKGNLVNTVNVKLSKHGLTARWDLDQSNNMIKVTCILSHSLGHSESVPMSAPPDDSGSKNTLQQIKSTKTYLEIATYEAVIGVASCDDPGDTDGNLPAKLISTEQKANLSALIEEIKGTAKKDLFKWAKIKNIEELPESKYRKAVSALEAKRS